MNNLNSPARAAQSSTRATSTVIARRGMKCFRDVRGAQLRIVCGAVWLTQSGSTDDIALGPGESFRITHNGLTIVSAGHASASTVVLLQQPVPAPTMGERLYNVWRAVARHTHPAMGGR